MVIDDSGSIREKNNSYIAQGSTRDVLEVIHEIMDDTRDILKIIPEKVVDPKSDMKVDEDIWNSKVGNRNKSKVPKNHLIFSVIETKKGSMVIRRQSRLNEIGFICYTSELEPKNIEKALKYES